MLICSGCGVAVMPSQVPSHLREQHKTAKLQVDQPKFMDACQSMRIAETFPTLGYGPMEQIEGLTLREGYLCDICFKPYGTENSMREHCRKLHTNIPCPKKWQKVPIQQLDRGSHKSFFRVLPKKAVATHPAELIVQQLRNSLSAQERRVSGPLSDARLISPWLRTCKWHELVKNKDINELIALVKPIGQNEFPGVSAAIHGIFQGTTEALDVLPELFLQRLNNPDPAK